MSELGALLKQAREKKGFSLEDIQDLTKIQKRYLQAIEEGNYKVLPGRFYVRAFVKNYAEAVGLNTDEVLEQFNREAPPSVTDSAPEPVMMPRRSASRSSDRFSKWGFTLLMWMFLVLIVVIFYIFVIKQPDNNNKIADQNTNITNESKPPAADNSQPQTNEPTGGEGTGQNTGGGQTEQTPPPSAPASDYTLTFVEKKGSTEYYTVDAVGAKTYTMKVNGKAWSEIREENNKGKVLQSGMDDAGKEYTFEVQGGIFFNLGRADNVEISLNGKPLQLEQTKSTSRKIVIAQASSPGETGQQ